jgi:hypothetical protein
MMLSGVIFKLLLLINMRLKCRSRKVTLGMKIEGYLDYNKVINTKARR